MLDVACGPGYAAAQAAARGAAAVGVDIADAMIALARRRYPDVEVPARRRARAHVRRRLVRRGRRQLRAPPLRRARARRGRVRARPGARRPARPQRLGPSRQGTPRGRAAGRRRARGRDRPARAPRRTGVLSLLPRTGTRPPARRPRLRRRHGARRLVPPHDRNPGRTLGRARRRHGQDRRSRARPARTRPPAHPRRVRSASSKSTEPATT